MKQYMKVFQKQLASRKFNPGAIDGIGGSQTGEAFQEWLRSLGFPVDVIATRTSFTVIPSPSTEHLKSKDYPWMVEARRLLGRHESRDTSWLSKWLGSDGRRLGDPRKLPWCGDFVETAIRLTLPAEPFPGALGENPYWARNWAKLGVKCDPCVGCVLVFQRPGGGGHVGFAVGQDQSNLYVLGGNQSNAVTIAPIAKSRMLAARWPSSFPNQHIPLPKMDRNGRKVSTNEA